MNSIVRNFVSTTRYLYYFSALILILTVLALREYPGQGHVYVVFTIIANTLLYFGFRRKAIFFDTFVGIFFWLGFWLKVTVHVVFLDGQFNISVGNFDGSGPAFDRALLAASCGFLGLLVASYLRGKYVFTYPAMTDKAAQGGLFRFYQDHRKLVLSGFTILFLSVAITNLYFGIYQRGSIPRTTLPYGLGGVYSWLLLFGLASFSALILHFEFMLRRRTSYLAVILSLLEGFSSNVSLLSRGMVLHAGALGYGLFKSLRLTGRRLGLRFWATSFLLFTMLFGSSVLLVNSLRDDLNLVSTIRGTKVLILDRWVGIEGLVSVSSHPEQGWNMWNEAWKEVPSVGKLSFYDSKLSDSSYRNTDLTKHNYISLPGIIAFCFYPGSFLFLFTCMFLLGGLAAAIEISAFKLGGGMVILCALLAQVIASRFAHFGYAPGQSYLLLVSLYLNLLIIYLSNAFLSYWYGKKE